MQQSVFKTFAERIVFGLHRQFENRREFFSDAAMREAVVAAVWRDFYIKHFVGTLFLYPINLKNMKGERV
jgi:hypothetical protein